MSRVLLGDVAKERRETCKSSKDGYPIVGLEHLTPEEIKLTAWDEGKENTFSKFFREGDILFGRRRAYLKKAAVAPFDGICSGDITVIEPKPERIVPELLPFIIQNDALFDFAVGKSAGSLSPRVKWENLKNYEFELPDMEKQRELAKILWAIDTTKKTYQKLLQKTDELVKSQFIEMFGDPIALEKSIKAVPLGTVCFMKAGKFVKADDIHEVNENGLYPCFGGNGLRGYVDRYIYDGEYPIIGRQGALCGNVQYAKGQFYATEHAVVVQPTVRIDTVWLYHMLTLLNLNRLATGAAQPGLAVERLADVKIIVPPLILQEQYATFVRQSDKSKFELEQARKELDSTYKRVIAGNLG
ncbi:restriction endonuclease subunit S [Paenibacillus sp. 7124]|uniref:Restriction endonuclease subunit S n=1 Tax=Paenibacillus apii TaxID=1850370 RepID=A0A6M1PP42_9BACL|nr:restriction endonuclease subunit S [Paenibacillus apii]NGM83962.1 restriction endonuclease subunit S [Paenibacillus apii]